MVSLIILIAKSATGNKNCSKDRDCLAEQKCVIDKCKDACHSNPCASNATCKVSSYTAYFGSSQPNNI